MGFPRQEYWSGVPFPPPGDLPDPETEPTSRALAGGFFTTEPPGKCITHHTLYPFFTPSSMRYYHNYICQCHPSRSGHLKQLTLQQSPPTCAHKKFPISLSSIY